MDKYLNTFGVPFILLLTVRYACIRHWHNTHTDWADLTRVLPGNTSSTRNLTNSSICKWCIEYEDFYACQSLSCIGMLILSKCHCLLHIIENIFLKNFNVNISSWIIHKIRKWLSLKSLLKLNLMYIQYSYM